MDNATDDLDRRNYEVLKGSNLLWHYTTWEGLHGIITNGELWASHVAYLNDTSEFWHGFELFGERLPESERLIKDEILGDARSRNVSGVRPTYVVSFTEEFDSLAQWRGYAGSSIGFALGFDRTRLQDRAATWEFRLAKCTYAASEKEALLEPLLARLRLERQQQNPRLRNIVLESLPRIAAELKNESFTSEQEYRLISNETSENLIKKTRGIEFRAKGRLFVPYIKLDIKKSWDSAASVGSQYPLRAVLIGPTADKQLMKHAVVQLTQRVVDYPTTVGVASSIIPYRNW
jgi:hypothetical protein